MLGKGSEIQYHRCKLIIYDKFMNRTKSSKRWLQEHFDDVYVKKAQAEGYRSRAVYKLKEVDEKESSN